MYIRLEVWGLQFQLTIRRARACVCVCVSPSGPSAQLKYCFKKKTPALLRYDSHPIDYSPFKVYSLWFLVESQSCAVITTVNFRTSLPPKRKPQTHERSLPISPSASSQPLATADLLFVSGLAYSGHVRSVGSYNMWPLVSELFRFGIMLSSSLHGGIHHYSIPLRS